MRDVAVVFGATEGFGTVIARLGGQAVCLIVDAESLVPERGVFGGLAEVALWFNLSDIVLCN